MPVSLPKELRRASFRGVAFEVSSTKLTVGRRVQVFEYPQRDIPFVEDLGRSARTVTLSAYVAGPGYIAHMKRLIAACETAGSGTLIDPWLGRMTVTPKALSSPVFDSTGVAKIELTFVESGVLKFPGSAVDGTALCQAAADSLLAAVSAEFLERFDVSGALDYVKNSVATDIVKLLSTYPVQALSQAVGMATELADLISDVPALVEAGARELADGVAGALSFAPVAAMSRSWTAIASRACSVLAQDAWTEVVLPATESVAGRDLAAASNAARSLLRGVMASNIPGVAMNVGTARDELIDGMSAASLAYDDLVAVRSSMLDAVDGEMLRTSSDDVFEALMRSRSAIYQNLTDKAEPRARLMDHSLGETVPSLVLAYDLYGDAMREGEIAARNKTRNAGFLPARTIKVLSA